MALGKKKYNKNMHIFDIMEDPHEYSENASDRHSSKRWDT